MEPHIWSLTDSRDIRRVLRLAGDRHATYSIDFSTGSSRRAVVVREEMKTFFGPQIGRFIDSPDCDDIITALAARIGLIESFLDTIDYQEFLADPHWIIENVWFSDGRDEEVQERYYMSGEGEHLLYQIDIYTMVFYDMPSPSVEDILSVCFL